MKSLKWTIVWLLICVTALFNIEHLDYGKENIVNIDSFVYILAIIAVLLVIMFPRLWRFSAAMPMALLVYLSCKLLFFKSGPLFGGIHTYVSITEITLFTLIIWLAARVSIILQDFEAAIEDFAISGIGNRVKPLHHDIEEARMEVIRSRRYNRPLGVIVVEPEPASINIAKNLFIRDVQSAMMNHYVFSQVGQVLSRLLRRTDRIMEQREKGRFVILCPETNTHHFKELTERIQASVARQLKVSVSCGASSFPDESYTFEDLLKKAEKHLIPQYELTSSEAVRSSGRLDPKSVEPSI